MALNLKTLRIALWALVGVAALGATGLYVYSNTASPAQAQALGAGDYQLQTTQGQPFNRETLVGHPTALFFGFTHCPEVCPTTLAEMSVWFEQLGKEAKDLEAYFVTVDPERDTAKVIEDYVAWTGVVQGVTGRPEELAKATKAWAVYAQKVPLEGGDYTMDHTASVFLLDRDGNFFGTIAYREDSKTALEKLRRLVAD